MKTKWILASLAALAQKRNKSKTLLITTLAGCGLVLFITIFETGVPSQFRLFFYDQRKQARSVPAHATVKIETIRPDGACQTFAFRGKGEYLESTSDIPEPHEFKAIVRVSHGSHTHTHEVQFSEHDHAHHARGG